MISMEKIQDGEYSKYILCTFEEEIDIISQLKALGFNTSIKQPCDCEDPWRIEGVRIIDTDSLKEVFSIAKYLTNVLSINVYPRIYSNNELGTGFYLVAYCRTQIHNECELFDSEQYINIVYDHEPMFAKLEK